MQPDCSSTEDQGTFELQVPSALPAVALRCDATPEIQAAAARSGSRTIVAGPVQATWNRVQNGGRMQAKVEPTSKWCRDRKGAKRNASWFNQVKPRRVPRIETNWSSCRGNEWAVPSTVQADSASLENGVSVRRGVRNTCLGFKAAEYHKSRRRCG